MNSKTTKILTIQKQIFSFQPESAGVLAAFKELSTLNLETCHHMWEYFLTENSSKLCNEAISVETVEEAFSILLSASVVKTTAYVYDNLPLIKSIYTHSASSCTQNSLQFLANAIMTNKLDAAENILNAVKSNTCLNLDFGERMRAVVEKVFALSCAKHGSAVAVLSKKQSTLLLNFVSKIKGPNKALLSQRIKEL